VQRAAAAGGAGEAGELGVDAHDGNLWPAPGSAAEV
jgi:hypothetical protein